MAAPDRLSRAICTIAGIYAFVGGLISFAGWPLDIPQFTDWFNLGVSMQPNTAVLMALAGAALILLCHGGERIAIWLGAIVAITGLLTLTQYIVGADFGFNHQLLFGREWGSFGTVTRGRMGPPASASFALLGASLLILALSQRGHHWAIAARRFIPPLALIVCTFMLFSLTGYLMGAREFYTVPWLTAIALQTASMLMAAGLALIAAVPERNPLQLLRENTGAAAIGRFALPLLILIPVAVASLRTVGRDLGLYDEGTGRALAVLVLIIAGVSLMWIALKVLRRHESALRNSETRLRSIIDQLPAGVGVMDSIGRWLLTNPTMDRYVPSAIPSILPGHSSRWRFWDEHGNHIPPEHWPAQRALRGEVVLPDMEGLYTDDDGREIWMRVSAAPLRNDANQVIGATTVVQDIDLPKRFNTRLHEELNKRAVELASLHEQVRRTEAMAILGSLSSGIAHDLGNLLFPLRTRLQMLRRCELSDDVREHVDGIERKVGYIAELASRLRRAMSDVAREHQLLEGSAEVIDVWRWCRDAEQFLRTIVPVPLTLVCDVPRDLPPIFVNKVGLTQAVYNLIQNAVKAIRSAGIGQTITLRAAACKTAGEVQVIVQDDGPGMSPDVLARCLQAQFTTDAETGGMGLGLSLVQAFARAAGGDVEVFSPPAPKPNSLQQADASAADHTRTSPQRGTAVVMRLPIHLPAPAEITSLKPDASPIAP